MSMAASGMAAQTTPLEPKKNEGFWRHKIEANVARDERIDAALEEAGWMVVRVWEHEAPEAAADRIERLVRNRVQNL